MIKKIIIIPFLFLFGCGYQPIYTSNNLNKLEFYTIHKKGNEQINKAIITSANFFENKTNKKLNELYIDSVHIINENSLNSKKNIQTYNSKVVVNLIIKNNEKITKQRVFIKEQNYDNKENRFEVIEYQNKIKQNLIEAIIEEIILYLRINDS